MVTFADGLNRIIGYKGRKTLRGEDEIVEYTEEQVAEIERCIDDPIYFIKTYVKIVHVDHGFIPLNLYPFQEEIIRTIHENRFVIGKLPRQVGKCVCINTNIRVRYANTGEIYDTTIGNFYETNRLLKEQREIATREERGERFTLSGFNRRHRLRYMCSLWPEIRRLNESCENSRNNGQRIFSNKSLEVPEIFERTIRENSRKQESGISAWGEIFPILAKIHQGRHFSRNSSESGQYSTSQLKHDIQYKLLDDKNKRQYGTGDDISQRTPENLYTGQVHSEVWGNRRPSHISNQTRQMAGNTKVQNARRIIRNQSKETSSWRFIGARKRIGEYHSRTHENGRNQTPIHYIWSNSKLHLRYSVQTDDSRVQWGLLARQPRKIFRERSFASWNDSPTTLGQGQGKDSNSRISRIQSAFDMGKRIQERQTEYGRQNFDLSERIERKFIDSIPVSDIEIWTDAGWKPVTDIHKTIEYEIWNLKTIGGKSLFCADDHIVFRDTNEQVFVKDLMSGDKIITASGIDVVSEISSTGKSENMFDLAVDSEDHRYYTDGILSHNTTTVGAYILWYILFNDEKNVAILANKAGTAREIMSRVQKSYESLPKFIQQGVKVWNKGSIELANGSKVFADATSGSAVRGRSFSLILLDEFAHVENHLQEPFFTSTYPTISSGNTTKVVIISTPKGMNMFYEIWQKSVRGNNEYERVEVHWSEVPGRDQAWFDEQLRNTSEVQVAQEILCEFLGSSHTLISGAKLRQLEQSWIEPIETKEQTHLRIYERPIPGHTYAVTVDVATGLGGDAQAFSVIDVTDFPFKQVAVFDNNHLYYMLYPQVIANVATWYNEAFVLIEINDVGQAVSYMMQVEIGYDNLIKIKPKGKQGQQVSGGFQKLIQYGLKSTTATKRIGCAALKALVETDKLIIQDFKTVHELMTFVEDNESFAADESSSGAHDDIAMTLVLFGWLSDQQFFKDSVGNNIRTNLERQLRAIEDEDFVPFGFFVDNVDHTYEDAEDAVTKNPSNPWLS